MAIEARTITIGLVIPTLNEEPFIAKTLKSVQNQPYIKDIVVVDGGSSDNTLEIVKGFGVDVIQSPRGRGIQLETGWRAVNGDITWFLHADSIPPPNATTLISKAFQDPGVSCTAFHLAFNTSRWDLRLIAFATNLRSSLLKLPYGDQGIAVRRSDLEAVGGLPHWSYLEDVWLIENMRQRGKLKLLPGYIRTSPRYYQKHGIWRAVMRHKKIMTYWHKHRKPMPGEK